MKKFLLVLTIVAGSFLGCGKEEVPFKSTGTITGADLAMCPCCGGWFISIDAAIYHFESIPAGSGIDLDHETFPIRVSLDWIMDRNCGGIQYITIQRIKKN